MTKQFDNKKSEFTDSSKQIATLIASILHETVPSDVRLQIIKEELDTGRYTINSAHIASKLLEFSSVHDDDMTVSELMQNAEV